MPNFLWTTHSSRHLFIAIDGGGGNIWSNCHRLSVAVIQSCALKLMRRTSWSCVQTQRGNGRAHAHCLSSPHTGFFSINTWPIACGRHCALETRQNTKATTEMVFVIWLIFISNSVCAARYMRAHYTHSSSSFLFHFFVAGPSISQSLSSVTRCTSPRLT